MTELNCNEMTDNAKRDNRCEDVWDDAVMAVGEVIDWRRGTAKKLIKAIQFSLKQDGLGEVGNPTIVVFAAELARIAGLPCPEFGYPPPVAAHVKSPE